MAYLSQRQLHVVSCVVLLAVGMMSVACLFGGSWSTVQSSQDSQFKIPYSFNHGSGGNENEFAIHVGLTGFSTRAWGKSRWTSYSSMQGNNDGGNGGGLSSDVAKLRICGIVMICLLVISTIGVWISCGLITAIYPLYILENVNNSLYKLVIKLLGVSCLLSAICVGMWSYIHLSSEDEFTNLMGGFFQLNLSLGWCFILTIINTALTLVTLLTVFYASKAWEERYEPVDVNSSMSVGGVSVSEHAPLKREREREREREGEGEGAGYATGNKRTSVFRSTWTYQQDQPVREQV